MSKEINEELGKLSSEYANRFSTIMRDYNLKIFEKLIKNKPGGLDEESIIKVNVMILLPMLRVLYKSVRCSEKLKFFLRREIDRHLHFIVEEEGDV